MNYESSPEARPVCDDLRPPFGREGGMTFAQPGSVGCVLYHSLTNLPAMATRKNHKNRPTHEGPQRPESIRDAFHWFAHQAACVMGSASSFTVAVVVILVWAVTGPIFGFSDTWQLVINTGTTIVTFLMVFLIQNTQNRDARALHLKIDELLRALTEARTGLVNLEDMSEAELDRLQAEFERVSTKASEVEKRKEKARASRS